MKTKLALIGCGNMGGAIFLGLSKKKHSFEFFYYDPDLEKSGRLAGQTKGTAVKAMADLKSCDLFLLAVKPQQYDAMAAELKNALHAEAKIISVVTGISTPTLQKTLGVMPIARVMPNTPCLIGEGACAIFFTAMGPAEQRIVKEIFSAVALVFEVGSDDAIDASTAVIGSGPAYFFEIARIIAGKYATLGIDPAAAQTIVQQVVRGSALLMQQSTDSPETLRDKVTSK